MLKSQSLSMLTALVLLVPMAASAQLVVTGQRVYTSANAGPNSQSKTWDALTSAKLTASASSSGAIVSAGASANANTLIESGFLSADLNTGASAFVNYGGNCPSPCYPGSGLSGAWASISLDFSVLSATDVLLSVQDTWASRVAPGVSSNLTLFKKTAGGQVAVVDRALLGTLKRLDAGDYALNASFSSDYNAGLSGGGATGGGLGLSIKALTSPVPEPAQLAAMGLGLLGVAWSVRRHRPAHGRP